MNINTRIQKLEPDTEVMLFKLNGNEFGAGVLRFHGHAILHTPQELAAAGANADQPPAKSIWWRGQEYSAWPVQTSGIKASDNGTAVHPKFSAGNVMSSITALCLAFGDLANFQLIIRETLMEYLDTENFPDGNPDTDPTQESISVWYIGQKSTGDNEAVTWDLTSSGDVGNEAVGKRVTTLCR